MLQKFLSSLKVSEQLRQKQNFPYKTDTPFTRFTFNYRNIFFLMSLEIFCNTTIYTASELRQLVVSDPFDRSEHPRQLKLVELTDWLEALVT